MLSGFIWHWNADFRRNTKTHGKSQKMLGKINKCDFVKNMIKKSKHVFVYKTFYLGFLCSNNALFYDL